MFSDPVLQPSAIKPMAVLWFPMVLSSSALRPMAVLLSHGVVFERAAADGRVVEPVLLSSA